MNLGGAIHLNKTGIVILCTILGVLFIYSITYRNNEEKLVVQTGNINLRYVLEVALKAAENGGKEVVATKDHLKIKSKGQTKEGAEDSVTTADFRSHCSMVATLKRSFPQLKVISEEAATECDKNQIVEFDSIDSINYLPDEFVDEKDVTVWIDPLDATHEYTEKLYDFVTTMVCVAVKGKPIIGVIHGPFTNAKTSWAWVGKDRSDDLKTRKPTGEKIKIIISISHSGTIENVLKKNFQNYELIEAAGAGYKALQVATGNADAYVHITAIKKWDICAGNAIIDAIGGRMSTKFDKLIDYTDETNVKNEDGLIATLQNHDLFIGKL